MSVGIAHFGGPDRPRGALRDLLCERVSKVPAGGSIDWVTYYFRDRRLAQELVAAHERGVDLRVTIEGRPRSIHANDAVLGILREPLGKRLRVVQGTLDGKPLSKLLRSRLHSKLYCFSDPEPVAIVGSFNPSGDEPEEHPELVEEIGDHDRGHNALVELRAKELVGPLQRHARRLHGGWLGPWRRLLPSSNRPVEFDSTALHFWPRASPHPIKRFLFDLPAGSRVRLAASHLSGAAAEKMLLRLAGQGVSIDVLTDQTDRRASPELVARLGDAGISLSRVVYDEWVPMHNKFALVESEGCRSVVFGSFNWSRPSQRYNHEIGVIARDPELFSAFADRWEVLAEQVRLHDSSKGGK
jgi:phosphatidylserine/phosphatidylglycerophosphate/cardiolipin synthase-like enzyme